MVFVVELAVAMRNDQWREPTDSLYIELWTRVRMYFAGLRMYSGGTRGSVGEKEIRSGEATGSMASFLHQLDSETHVIRILNNTRHFHLLFTSHSISSSFESIYFFIWINQFFIFAKVYELPKFWPCHNWCEFCIRVRRRRISRVKSIARVDVLFGHIS